MTQIISKNLRLISQYKQKIKRDLLLNNQIHFFHDCSLLWI